MKVSEYNDPLRHRVVKSKAPVLARTLVLLVTAGFALVVAFSCVFYAAHAQHRMLQFQNELTNMKVSLHKRSAELESRVRRSVSRNNFVKKPIKHVVKRNANEPVVVTTPQPNAGVTYIRWGRRDCPKQVETSLVYHGSAAGGHHTHTGGSTDVICLAGNISYTEERVKGGYITGKQANSHLYGLEYRDSSWVNNLLDYSLTENVAVQYHSVPCALCMATRRLNQLMIPGRNECPEGWFLEYTGYMMSSSNSDKHGIRPLCVDDTPQVVPGTQGNQQGASLFMMETSCISLLCEPVVAGREIRCVVCTI
nr:uncharacterized protein LOC100183700 isoform X2 [Ciona intestinalis]XP_026692542.1 uncharacterized protein LOC100183700 isoform X2 [Ciona intestinalis]|eukprot:XP_018669511.1 uncharacterized protein LOC100183700 isoform X2 [Ciona intestinalis]